METIHSDRGEWHVPDRLHVTAWTSGDIREDKPVYFWATPDEDLASPIFYRAYPEGGEPGDWRPMRTSAEVFAETGFEDDEEDDEEDLTIGAAEILPVGIYRLELKVDLHGEPVLLTGVRFEVASRAAPKGGGQIRA
jgi:hypothetical protein